MDQLVLENKEMQEQLQVIFGDIDGGVIQNDEYIIEDLNEILLQLNENDKLVALKFINYRYQNRTFVQFGNYQLQDIEQSIQEQDFQQDYQKLKEERDHVKLFVLLNNAKFCQQNKIFPQITQNIRILRKTEVLIFDILYIMETQCDVINFTSQFDILMILIKFIDFQMPSEEKKILDSVIGSLLVVQIYQLQNYIEYLKNTTKEEEFSKFIKELQQLQICFYGVDKQNQITDQNLIFLMDLFTQDISKNKENLMNYLCKVLRFENNQHQSEIIIDQIGQFIFNGINIGHIYFQIAWYFWTSYVDLKYRLNDELVQQQNIMASSLDQSRRSRHYQRFLKPILQKVQESDEVYKFYLTNRVLYNFQIEKSENNEIFQKKFLQILNDQQQVNFKQLNDLKSMNSEVFIQYWKRLRQLQFHYLPILEGHSLHLKQLILFLWANQEDDNLKNSLKAFAIQGQNLFVCAQQMQIIFENKSQYFLKNLFLIVSEFNSFNSHYVQLLIKIYTKYNDFSKGEIVFKFLECANNKNFNDLMKIKEFSEQTQEQWDLIFEFTNQQSMSQFTKQILQCYLNELNKLYLIFINLLLKQQNQQQLDKQIKSLKIILENIDLDRFHELVILNHKTTPNQQIVNDTLKELYILYDKIGDDLQQEYIFQELKSYIVNDFYQLELIHSFKKQGLNNQLINKIVLAYYFKSNKQLQEMISTCKEIFNLDEMVYTTWLKPYNYFNIIEVTPQQFKRQQIKERYPVEMKIKLEEFNISLVEFMEKEYEQLIQEWVQNMNNQDKFKKLLPLYFNIIKRGENASTFLSLMNSKKPKQFIDNLNMKALFQILFNNSNDELKVILLKFRQKNHPVPFIYQNLLYDSVLNEQDYFTLNYYLFYIFPSCFPIINFSLSNNIKQIGKTFLINNIFYQSEKFEISDSSEINNNTIDIIFDYSFNGTRHFAVADSHGEIPISIYQKILPLFKLWIIQMDTENELEENLSYLEKLSSVIGQYSPKICFIVRNSDKGLQKQNWNVIQKIQNENNISLHFMQNLIQKKLDKQSQQNEIDIASKFIYNQIYLEESQNNNEKIIINDNYQNRISQNDFLQLIKNFNNQSETVYKKIEQAEQIIQQFEQEIQQLSEGKEGFFSLQAFPLRYVEKKRKEKQIEITSKRQQSNNSPDDLLKDDFEKIRTNINQNKILLLFRSIFQQPNYYVLFLSFVDRIRKINDNNTYALQDEILQLNIKIQKLKLDKKSIIATNQGQDSQNSEQIQKEILNCRMKIEENQRFVAQRNIGIEIFWREIIEQRQQSINYKVQISEQETDPEVLVYELIQKGEAFEFLDGDQLKINQEFFQSLIRNFDNMGNEKVLVLSVLGPQSSGKSTILNQIFGCHFWTSVGRCTKGIYFQLLKIHNKTMFNNLFDYIVILDTEGLQNPNQKDPEFDKKIALLVLAISDIIIINVRGDIHQQFRNLIEMCIYSLGQLRTTHSQYKQLSWCFNQNNFVDLAPFLDQIQGIANNLNEEYKERERSSQSSTDNKTVQNELIDYTKILDIRKENIKILGFQSYEKKWQVNQNLGIFQEWRQQFINETFSQDAYNYGISMILNFVKKMGDDQSLTSLNAFFQKVAGTWDSINKLPDLLEFTELIQHQQNNFMQSIFQNLKNEKNMNFAKDIQKEISYRLNNSCRTNFQVFNKLQEEMESKYFGYLDQIKTDISQKINEIKISNNISKKIAQKYQDMFMQIIQQQKVECKTEIFGVISNYKMEYQNNQGYAQINNFLENLYQDHAKLNQFLTNPQLVKSEFTRIWKQIIFEFKNQQEILFEEFQSHHYESLTQQNREYYLQSKNEEKYKTDIKKMLKQIPDDDSNQFDNIYELFKSELNQHLFTQVDKIDNNMRYMDIFNQSILVKIRNCSRKDLLNIGQFYKYEVKWTYIEQIYIYRYLNSKQFYDDLLVQIKNYQKKQNIIIIHEFLSIINHFELEYDGKKYKKLIKTIQSPKKSFTNSFKKLSSTFKYKNVQQTNYLNSDFQRRLPEFYPQLNQKFIQKQFIFDTQESLLQGKNQIGKEYFFIDEQIKVVPVEDYSNQSHDENNYANYLLDPIQIQNFQIPYAPQFLNEQMEKQGGWKRLYFQVYDYIKQEMIKSNKPLESNILCSVSNDQIKIIMGQIEQKIVDYNKQFAIYGVILNALGERCIYYFSILMIWRFNSYIRWQCIVNNYEFEKRQPIELEMFTAQITENKIEQSKLIAKNLVENLQKEYLNYCYEQATEQAIQKVKSYSKTSQELIKQLDETMLSNYQLYNFQMENQINDQIFEYITKQKEFIQQYVEKYLQDKKDEILEEINQQSHLQENLIKLFKQILSNANKLQAYLNQDAEKIKNYFTIQINTKKVSEHYEKILFKIVIACLNGCKAQDLGEVNQIYCQRFTEGYEKIDIPISLNLLNEKDSKIPDLQNFLNNLIKQLKQQVDKTKYEWKFHKEKIEINEILESIRLKMIGCQYSCPMCNRKCDMEQGHNKNDKHTCNNGHQLRGMNKVLIQGFIPSLLTCEEIDNNTNITVRGTDELRKWSDVKKQYEEWNFKHFTKEQAKKSKSKFENIWNSQIGEVLCSRFSKELAQEVPYETKNYLDQRTEKVHYIFVIDASIGMFWLDSSMKTQIGVYNCIKGLKANPNARVSVITFRMFANIIYECCTPNEIYIDENLTIFSIGISNLEWAFDAVFGIMDRHDPKKFNRTIVMVYSADSTFYPGRSVQQFKDLSALRRSQTLLLISSECNEPENLERVVKELQNYLRMAKLQRVIQNKQVDLFWSEVIQQPLNMSQA